MRRNNWNFYERSNIIGKIIGYIIMAVIGYGLGQMLNEIARQVVAK